MTRSQKNNASAPKREQPKRSVVQARKRTQKRGLRRSVGRSERVATTDAPKETSRGRVGNRRVNRRPPSMPRLCRMISMPRLTPQRPLMSCRPNHWMENTPPQPHGPPLAPQPSWSYIPVEFIEKVDKHEISSRNHEQRLNLLEQEMRSRISNQNSRPRCVEHEDLAQQVLDVRDDFRRYKTMMETEINRLADSLTESIWTYHRVGPCKMEAEGPWQS